MSEGASTAGPAASGARASTSLEAPPAGPAVVAGPAATLRRAWAEHPLAVTLALGGALRLVAAFASPGFAFHDDHYEVVEIAGSWVAGGRDWLGQTGSWRSLVYPGLHWLVFRGLRALGVDDPQAWMLVVRVLHAAWSVVGLYYAFRLAEAVGGPRAARRAGLLQACFWVAPFAAVHDLVEVVCQPPLLAGTWLAVRADRRERGEDRQGPGDLLRAGLWFGLAFTFRFQTAVVPAALLAVLLLQRRPRQAAALALGTALSAGLLQGGSDWIGYGRPFSSVMAYLRFNSDPSNIAQFPRGPWHQYLGTLAGLLVPPTSLLLLAGFLRSARSAPRAFWPTLAFLVLHSAYPGKQERFLFPVLPLVLLLGAAELDAVAAWGPLRRRRVWRGLWGWFWAVNLILLALFTTTYSKRARVAPLSFLRGRGDVRALLVDKSQGGPPFVPRFYLGRPAPVVLIERGTTPEQLRAALAAAGAAPNYAVIEGEQDLAAREARLRALFPRAEPLATFEPSLVDWAFWKVNPRFNVNLVARVYRVE